MDHHLIPTINIFFFSLCYSISTRMENEIYDFIADVDTVKDSLKLKVRVLSLWKSSFQLDMIVMDERRDKIHATVKKVLIPVFENVLQEGVVVMLSKFGVGANNDKYPVLRHTYKLKFYRSTYVKRVLAFDGPMHDFQFLPFSDVFDNLGDVDLPVDRYPIDKSLSFKITRKQFPISMCFAMTINKSQGQSLSHVGFFLPRPVFTHGQLYVAISRVTNKKGLKVLICDPDMNVGITTKNVVFKEVLQRL